MNFLRLFIFTSCVQPSKGIDLNTFIGRFELSWIVDESKNIATVLLIKKDSE